MQMKAHHTYCGHSAHAALFKLLPSHRVMRQTSIREQSMNIFTTLSTSVALAVAAAAPAFAEHHKHGDAASQTIVDIAVGNPDFSTLVTALKAADLVGTLSGAGPFTVFAPTNDAFAKLPAGTVEDLLKPENKAKLTAVLTYHVVGGKVLAADVVGLSEATTVQGGKLSIKVNGSSVMVDNANVVKTDIVGSNGVIHVIDNVVLPK
jgi:uncharacterized surface protein with fasciclin (FAS1) repeats